MTKTEIIQLHWVCLSLWAGILLAVLCYDFESKDEKWNSVLMTRHQPVTTLFHLIPTKAYLPIFFITNMLYGMAMDINTNIYLYQRLWRSVRIPYNSVYITVIDVTRFTYCFLINLLIFDIGKSNIRKRSHEFVGHFLFVVCILKIYHWYSTVHFHSIICSWWKWPRPVSWTKNIT